jgi:hypothetical protein
VFNVDKQITNEILNNDALSLKEFPILNSLNLNQRGDKNRLHKFSYICCVALFLLTCKDD